MSCGQPAPDETQELPAAVAPAATCVRCSLPPGIVVRTTSYCWEHFHDHFTFAYRKGIDGARTRSRSGRPQDVLNGAKRGTKRSKVMLAFSGGASSRVLLDLLQKNSFTRPDDPSLSNPRFKPPPTFESLEILYVDESGVPGFGPDRTEEVRALVAETPFPFRSIKLESIFTPSTTTFSTSYSTPSLLTSTSTSTPLDPLTSLLSFLSPSTHSPTSLASLHSSLLHSLLRREALSSGCEILLTGETANRVAIQTIAGMAEGRGFSMGEEVGCEWEASEEEGGGLLVARPLSSILLKEVTYYARIRELESLTMRRPETGVEPKKAGIEALVQDFVNGLEANFPSTVSTIIRTAQKLGMRSADERERKVEGIRCPLCGLPAQLGAEDWRKAITISTLSDLKSAAPSSSSTPSLPAPAAAADLPSPEAALAPLLCYSCLLIMQGTLPPPRGAPTPDEEEKVVVLPPYVEEMARRRRRIAEEEEGVVGRRTVSGVEGVRREVEGYLLDE
ncbi:hypothetical protein BCR35DRAFT_353399 [Leucosporidium creatinivorum]|uniref:Cytoplasmic tRNA 2-thiolation protein 2 n=1 Tax=Leucosporidium creatinivorum TaxID=106004 RepID=A0A1Y2EXE2_9BASI|nr:hypothetical protein BCR35DRAFT_353399 [Leucosporidium creatinivorum]